MFHPLAITRYALYALLIFTPLARGSVQGWAICIIHIVTLVALSAFILDRCIRWEWAWAKTPLDKPLFVIVAICLFSSFFSIHFRSSIWSLALFFNYLVIFYVVIFSFSSRELLTHLIYVIIAIGVFLSFFGMFKRLGLNPFPWWNYGDLKYSLDFLSSTYGNHNHLAGYLEMVMPLILGLLLIGFKGGKLLVILYLLFITVTAFIFSLSRGGWISFLLAVSFMTFSLLNNRYFKARGFVLTLGIASLSMVIIVFASTPVVERIISFMEKEEEAGFYSRIVAWTGIVKMIKERPAFGTGPGTFSTAFAKYQPPGLLRKFNMAHNDYLHFIAEAGVFLIPFIIWMFIVFYKRGFFQLRCPSRFVRGVTLGAMSGVTAILFHSIIDLNLHIPANALLFTVLAAIVVAPFPTQGNKTFSLSNDSDHQQ